MTAIVYKDGKVAADTQVTNSSDGHICSRSFKKLFVAEMQADDPNWADDRKAIIGISGDMKDLHGFLLWWVNGCPTDDPPYELDKESSTQMNVFCKDRAYSFSPQWGYSPETAEYKDFDVLNQGSATSIINGLSLTGLSAEEIVRVVAHHNAFIGGDYIDIADLKTMTIKRVKMKLDDPAVKAVRTSSILRSE